MRKFVELVKRLNRDERGATIVEYGVALTIVTAIAFGVLQSIGDETAANFGEAENLLGGTEYTATGG